MREVRGHEGSSLNNVLAIAGDERDKNGGTRLYTIVDTLESIVHRLPMFQQGPLQEAGHNGITDEALLAIVVDRLEGFNEGPFRCRENSLAITHIQEALHWLQHRTAARMRRGVEGTHNP